MGRNIASAARLDLPNNRNLCNTYPATFAEDISSETVPFLTGPRPEMGQRLARQDVDEGIKLYHLQKHDEAIEHWRKALRKLKTPEDRFITMGFLAQAHSESGRFKDMLVYALHQIDLANERDDTYMKAEAYLNLSRANERLCEFHKAISYGKHSLQNQSMDPRTPGYAYLCIGSAYLGFSNFQFSLENFEQAMRVATATQDRLLELQICVGLGSLFTQLQDLSKAVVFLKNALSLLNTVSIDDVHAKYKSLVLYHLSVALRRKGSFQDAKSACEEALKLAAENGNRPVQGRCLHSLGDLHREYKDTEKTWAKYEAALALMDEIADKMGQIIVLASMAKAAVTVHKPSIQQCECQAIQFNKKCLDIAKSIGCKLAMLKCHARLQRIYNHLNDEESEEVARKAVTAITQELELFCNFCGQRYAIKDESLQALPCSHIFHERAQFVELFCNFCGQRYGIEDESLQALLCSHIFRERCLQNYLSSQSMKDCPKCRHRATSSSLGELDNAGASTSAIGAHPADIGTAYTPDVGASTSAVVCVTMANEIPTSSRHHLHQHYATYHSGNVSRPSLTKSEPLLFPDALSIHKTSRSYTVTDV